ncbi:MAG: acyl carrier protein [Cyclobacteriaceae bacterium]|nr:acyl carrier protein [Cyclobacteriaceae bacterium]
MALMSESDLIQLVSRIVSEETQLDLELVSPDKHWATFGLDSINSIYLLEKLENELGVDLNPLMFFDYPTIRTFSAHILTLRSS